VEHFFDIPLLKREYNEIGRSRRLDAPDRRKEVPTMKTVTPRTMMPGHRMSAAMKTLMGKKLRMMKNHNVHVITHHGKLMVGRKGRKA
jgi:hypothetical protein